MSQFLVFVSKFKIAVSHRVLKFHTARCPFKVACRVTHKLQIQQQVCYHTSFFHSHFPILIRANLCGLFTRGPVVSSCACCAALKSEQSVKVKDMNQQPGSDVIQHISLPVYSCSLPLPASLK